MENTMKTNQKAKQKFGEISTAFILFRFWIDYDNNTKKNYLSSDLF